MTLTKSGVRRAGVTIRRFVRDPGPKSADELDRYAADLDVVREFRAAHAVPMTVANNSLRSMLKTAGSDGEGTQRLKRLRTIIDKISVRETTLPLTEMHDIGGVRAVLPSIADIRAVEARLRNTGRVVGYYDYISEPRQSGYRGAHVIVLYRDRKIEVQLRTRAMHSWALAVETMSASAGENFKQDGTHPVQRMFRIISDIVSARENGLPVTAEQLDRLRRARHGAQLGGQPGPTEP